MTDMDYGSWTLNHPWRAFAVFMACAVAGALIGVLIVANTPAQNSAAAAGVIGVAGALSGIVTGLIVIHIISKRRS